MISDTQNGPIYEIQNIECYKHDELKLFKCKMQVNISHGA